MLEGGVLGRRAARARRWRPRLGAASLGTRLALLTLIAAVPVLAFEIKSQLESHHRRMDAAGRDVARAARLIAAEQDQFFDNARSILATLLRATTVQERRTAACSTYLTRLLPEFPAYTGIGIAGPDGVIFCASDAQLIGSLVGGRDYFQEALSRKRFAIGTARRGVASGARILGMAYPVLNPFGDVDLVGILGLDLAAFSQAMPDSALQPDSVVLAIDASGAIVARSSVAGQWIGRPVPAGLEPHPGELEEVEDVDGVRRLYAFTSLGENALSLGVGVPVTSLYAEAQQRLLYSLAILALVFGAAATLALLIGDLIIRRPLDALHAATERVASGDLAARTGGLSSVPEFARLARSFDAMAESLDRHERELQQALADRELLLKEMNHRIKNSLQLVSSLLALHSRSLDDPEARAQLAEAQGRVLTVARLHQRLYQSDQIGTVDFGAYLRELCEQLSDALTADGRTCEVVVEAGEIWLPVDQVVPLGLIANELITNAGKHAYPRGGGRVAVTLARDAEGGYRLEVADRGVGLPDDVDPAATPERLGLRLVVSLVQQIGAELSIDRSPPGCRFIVRLPEEPSGAQSGAMDAA